MPKCSIICCFGKKKDTVTVRSPTPREKFDILGYQPILEDEDRRLITESGRIMFNEKHIENLAVPFLIEFFKSYPEHQKYFKAFRNTPHEELTTLPVTENHGRKVMDEVKILVHHVNDPMKMKDMIWNLTYSHRSRKVKVTHLKDMLIAFIEFSKYELQDELTPDMEVAWKKFITFIMAVVEDEEAKGNAVIVSDEYTDVAESMTNVSGSRL